MMVRSFALLLCSLATTAGLLAVDAPAPVDPALPHLRGGAPQAAAAWLATQPADRWLLSADAADADGISRQVQDQAFAAAAARWNTERDGAVHRFVERKIAELIAAYGKGAFTGVAWDDDVERHLAERTRAEFGDSVDGDGGATTRALLHGQRALDAGCTDPLVIFGVCVLRNRFENHSDVDRVRPISRAAKAMTEESYGAERRLALRTRALVHLSQFLQHPPDKWKEWITESIALGARCDAEDGYPLPNLSRLARRIGMGSYHANLSREELMVAIAAWPKDPDSVRAMVIQASAYLGWAGNRHWWKTNTQDEPRRSSPAPEVQGLLERAWRRAPGESIIACLGMNIAAITDDIPSGRRWYRRALRAQPQCTDAIWDYYYVYAPMTMTMEPYHEHLRELTASAVIEQRYEALAIMRLLAKRDGLPSAFRLDRDWAVAKEIHEAYLARYPADADGWARYALDAVTAERWNDATAPFAQVADDGNDAIFTTRERFLQLRDRVNGMQAIDPMALTAIRTAIAQSQHEHALTLLKALRPTAAGESVTQALIARCELSMALQPEVPVSLHRWGSALWTAYQGTWNVTPQGITLTTQAGANLLILPPTSEDFELSGTIEVLNKTGFIATGLVPYWRDGIWLGADGGYNQGNRWRISQEMTTGEWIPGNTLHGPELQGPREILIRSWAGTMEIYDDRQLVIGPVAYRVHQCIPPGRIGIGARSERDGTTVLFSGLTLTKLTKSPGPVSPLIRKPDGEAPVKF